MAPDRSEPERSQAGRDTEPGLRATFTHGAVGIALVALDGRCRQVNRPFCDMMGYGPDEMTALGVQDVIHPADVDVVLDHARRMLSGDDTAYHSLETRYVRKDFSVVTLYLTVSLARTPDGKPDHFIFVVEPIRENREAEEIFGILANSIPQLCWMADPEGYLVWYNRRWFEYTGRTLPQMRGRKWAPVLDADVQQKVLDRWLQAIATGQPFDMEFSIKGKDGVFRPFLTRVEPVRDDAGRVIRWFGTSTDVGEMKRAETALREADRRKDEFLATLAHELRNGLAPVQNALEICELSLERSEAHERCFSLMHRHLEELARLVDDLLDVSRISAGKLGLRAEPMSLQTALHSAVETSRPLIDQMGHKLMVTLPAEPLTIVGDSVRLAQVIANLLINSAKYTNRGGNICLTAERHGTEACISVKDDGLGIAADQLPGVFRMFSQADRSAEQTRGGLGIGLTVAKQLVEMHGGTIVAASAGVGMGSEFVVRLPLAGS